MQIRAMRLKGTVPSQNCDILPWKEENKTQNRKDGKTEQRSNLIKSNLKKCTKLSPADRYSECDRQMQFALQHSTFF